MKDKTLVNSSGFDLYADTRELSLQLSAYMLWISEASKSFEEGYSLALKTLKSGKALEKFEAVVKRQGGDLSSLPVPKVKVEVRSPKKGFISAFNTEQIGMIGIKIKMGRNSLVDSIDPVAGFQLHKKIGDAVEPNEPIITLLGSRRDILEAVLSETLSTIIISENKVIPQQLIKKVII
jgi:pyrimidine-nucleoside phosphorylase